MAWGVTLQAVHSQQQLASQTPELRLESTIERGVRYRQTGVGCRQPFDDGAARQVALSQKGIQPATEEPRARCLQSGQGALDDSDPLGGSAQFDQGPPD